MQIIQPCHKSIDGQLGIKMSLELPKKDAKNNENE